MDKNVTIITILVIISPFVLGFIFKMFSKLKEIHDEKIRKYISASYIIDKMRHLNNKYVFHYLSDEEENIYVYNTEEFEKYNENNTIKAVINNDYDKYKDLIQKALEDNKNADRYYANFNEIVEEINANKNITKFEIKQINKMILKVDKDAILRVNIILKDEKERVLKTKSYKYYLYKQFTLLTNYYDN